MSIPSSTPAAFVLGYLLSLALTNAAEVHASDAGYDRARAEAAVTEPVGNRAASSTRLVIVRPDYRTRLDPSHPFLASEIADVAPIGILLRPMAPSGTALVINGWRAQKDQFPWTVLLARRGIDEVACSGVMVAPKWVLTAGHCLKLLVADDYPTANPYPISDHDLAYVGGTNLGDTQNPQLDDLGEERVIGTAHFVKEDDLEHYDIGLLRLTQAVPDIPQLPIVDVAPSAQPVEAIIVGYGTDENDAKNVLRSAPVHIVQQSACAGHAVTPYTMCAQDVTSVVCFGDSGGPLLVWNGSAMQLVGVANTVDEDSGCGLNAAGQREAVFARVSKYSGWISAWLAALP